MHIGLSLESLLHAMIVIVEVPLGGDMHQGDERI